MWLAQITWKEMWCSTLYSFDELLSLALIPRNKKISLKSGMHDKQKVNVIFIGLERLDPWNQIVLSGVISISITPLVNWSCTYIISFVDVWRGQSTLRLIVGGLFFFSSFSGGVPKKIHCMFVGRNAISCQISFLSYVVGMHPHAWRKIQKCHDCPIVLLELEDAMLLRFG